MWEEKGSSDGSSSGKELRSPGYGVERYVDALRMNRTSVPLAPGEFAWNPSSFSVLGAQLNHSPDDSSHVCEIWLVLRWQKSQCAHNWMPQGTIKGLWKYLIAACCHLVPLSTFHRRNQLILLLSCGSFTHAGRQIGAREDVGVQCWVQEITFQKKSKLAVERWRVLAIAIPVWLNLNSYIQ